MKIRNYFFIILVWLSASIHPASSQKITDTIFYNKSWAICEKTIAAYYRIGTLAIDSFWFYTGKIKDYTIKDSLVMEGEYTIDGYKNGMFFFYYPNGSLQATGEYKNDKMTGTWKWNYPDGTENAVIYFPDDEANFRFVSYHDKKGKLLLDNGNGDFSWPANAFDRLHPRCIVEGSFKDGKRSDTWKYYDGEEQNITTLTCKEVYKDGKFKRGKVIGYRYDQSIDSSVILFDFKPAEIKTTELIKYDNFFRKGGEANADMALINYLLNRKTAEIFVKDSSFEKAFEFIVKTLDYYRNELDYKTKDINGTIVFRLGDNNFPEEITVQGNNITDKEKEFLLFLMNKFRNIEMPGDKDIAIEGYHTIYFYVVNMKDFMPSEIKPYVGEELFFSPLKKEQFIQLMKARKKSIKKYFRQEYLNFW